jgi:hypothetical protein
MMVQRKDSPNGYPWVHLVGKLQIRVTPVLFQSLAIISNSRKFPTKDKPTDRTTMFNQ